MAKEKKFDLMMGSSNAGIILYNKAVEKNGDYRKVGFIYEWGTVEWYVIVTNDVPQEALDCVADVARDMREKWEKKLSDMPLDQRYIHLVSLLPYREGSRYVLMTCPKEERCRMMMDYLYRKE